MDKGNNLTLNEVGELIFNTTRFQRENRSGDRSCKRARFKMMTLLMQDGSRCLLKPSHKNHSNDLVFRIEVYKTKEGDHAEIAPLLEANRNNGTRSKVL